MLVGMLDGACSVYLPPPLTEAEKRQIAEPLARVLQKYNGELPAEVALIGAAVMILVPRVLAMRKRMADELAQLDAAA